MDLKGKSVTVIGLGNSGVNAAILLNSIGASVRATDAGDTPALKKSAGELRSKGIKVEIGVHTEDFVKGSELVVVSPGVENSSPALNWAVKFGIRIIGEMELGFRFCKGRIIAITGTNGKTTVTTLIGDILKEGGMDTVVCGNIGNSFCGEIPRIKDKTWVVMEVSSFQLEKTDSFKPHIALILNITDDHMDRYRNFKEYFKEKLKIFYNQDEKDYLIVNHDAENLRMLKDKASSKTFFYSRLGKTNGAYIKDEKIFTAVQGKVEEVCAISDIRLKGLHNVENVLACSLTGALAGIKAVDIKNAIRNFKGIEHRFESVETIYGVEYINDSKGTTVDSTYRALQSCEKPVVLIAGGRDKNSDYSIMKNIIKEKVVDLILIGEAKSKIRDAVGGSTRIHDAKDMSDAVRMAREIAKEGSLVLLSPMCASFDMFRNYEERGEVFKKAVRELKKAYQKEAV